MENSNRGPLTRMVKLPQGHYRRIATDEMPEYLRDVKMPEKIFEDLLFCCDNTCLVSEEEYAKLVPNSELYTDETTKTLQNETEKEEAEVFYHVYSSKPQCSVADMAVQTTLTVEGSTDVGVGQTKPFGTMEDGMDQIGKPGDEGTGGMMDHGHTIPDLVIENLATPEELQQKQAKQAAMTEFLAKFGGPRMIDVNNPDPFRGQGVPTLFYTKSRVNPTLVMMTIDYDMMVIYMSRTNVSRFFPVKLISRLVTNPEIIQEEFRKQVAEDVDIKLNCMVLINAANFTDSVAIQFPDPILKDRFVEDLKQLKSEIRTQAS